MKRPFGVWVIGLLAIIGAALRILTGLAALGVKGLDFTKELGVDSETLGQDARTIGIIMLVVGVLYLIFALSFIGLRRWAYVAMFIVQLLAIAAVVAQLVVDGYHWSQLVGLIIPVLILLYMLLPKVRRAFFKK